MNNIPIDFFKPNVNFSFYDYFLSRKVYTNFIHTEAGKGSVTWEIFINETSLNRHQVIAVCYVKVLKSKCKHTDRRQEDLQK